MDNAWDYNKGDSERPDGQGARRRPATGTSVFLMTKVDGRNARTTLDKQLERVPVDG